jgi:hypothetical protein
MRIECGAVLLDLDGVLVDSTPAVLSVWAHWAEKHALDPEQTARLGHGRPNIDTIRELLPHADHEAESREFERLEIEDVADLIPLPGALQLLSTLPMERWAIVTSCTRPLAEARIRAASLPMPKHLRPATWLAESLPPIPTSKGRAAKPSVAGLHRHRRCAFRDSIRQGRRSPRPRSADHDGIRTARKCRRGLDRPRLRSHRRGTEVQQCPNRPELQRSPLSRFQLIPLVQ